MERREGRRIKRRLTCEFFDGAKDNRGIILDVGPAGIFIRTNAVLSPGTEIDIHLASSVVAPAMTLRGRVVRRKSVPATLTTLIQPGLGVEILDAPREYGLLTTDSELDSAIQTDFESSESSESHRQQTASRTESQRKPTSDESKRDPSRASAERAEAASANKRDDDTKEIPSKSNQQAWKKEKKRDVSWSKRPTKAKAERPLVAVLVGGSTLDEIAHFLRDMGVEVAQCGPYDPELAALDDARLLVVTADVAMSDPIPVDTDTIVGIAVCGDISETMRSQIRQQGFRYLLRSHLHPEALRLLLRYAVYAERDRRGKVRHPVGCEVSWRSGWRRSQGRLLDISRGGCCLLVEDPPKVGAKISIKIPAEAVEGRAVKLRGKVLRITQNAAHTGNERTALGVVLEGLTPATRKILGDLCEKWSESPPMLPRAERPKAPPKVIEVGDQEDFRSRLVAHPAESKLNTETVSVAETKDATTTQQKNSLVEEDKLSATEKSRSRHVEETTTAAAENTRSSDRDEVPRSTRRAVFEQEIVQVDDEARAVQALLGRDLSIDGIRVARQLGLDPGNKLRLALFDASLQEPLILDAEVARDDGGSGLYLHFIDLSPKSSERIEAIISALPAVESIDPHGDASVVPTRVVSNQP